MTKPGEKLKVRSLFRLVEDDYEINEQSSIESARNHIKKLDPFFGDCYLPAINKALCLEYIKERRDFGAANSTINRELAVLKRGFSLYREDHQELSMPYIPKLKENNARKLAYTHRQYRSVVGAAEEHYAGPITFAYISSWREGTILDLQWGYNVDEDLTVVTAHGDQTKNDETLVIPLDVFPFTVLRDLLAERKAGRVDGCPYVFHYKGVKLTKSGLIKALRRAHVTAKVPYGRKVKGGLTFHDFKKSAIRNMLRVHRVPIDIVMKISGNLTREVFDKNYNNAIDEEDIRKAFSRPETSERKVSDQTSSREGKLAEREGFEPPRRFRLPDFETSVISLFALILTYLGSFFRKS